jgi:hypothetical protein
MPTGGALRATAAQREATNKKGIRCSQGANAGVVFQPAVTVSGALARMPSLKNTSVPRVRQEEIDSRRTMLVFGGPREVLSVSSPAPGRTGAR